MYPHIWIPAILLLLVEGAVMSNADEVLDDAKVYAIFFPQFHEDKLNNFLWGKGFTDWNNLNASAKFNRLEHEILRPTELGYYDLMDPDIRRRQGELAKQYGIDGFIFHHYWFNHMLLGASLNAAVDKMLEDGYPDIPFAFNWAQESWTNTWNGKYKYDGDIFKNPEVLIHQHLPRPTNILVKEHYLYLRKFFRHKNYILVNGCPLFFVYGNNQDPAVIAIRERLRELAIQDGFPSPGLHIPLMTAVKKHLLYHSSLGRSYHNDLVDAEVHAPYNDAVAFFPLIFNPNAQMALPMKCMRSKKSKSRWQDPTPKPVYAGVVTAYDNTPRRDVKTAKFFNRHHYPESLGGPVKSFEHDVVETLLYDKCCQKPEYRDKGGKFILINAWNEWGEGMVLEPSQTYGRKFLEAVANAKETAKEIKCDANKLLSYRRKNKYP